MFGIIRSSSAADSKEVGGRRNGLEIKPSQDGCAGRVEDFAGERACKMGLVKKSRSISYLGTLGWSVWKVWVDVAGSMGPYY